MAPHHPGRTAARIRRVRRRLLEVTLLIIMTGAGLWGYVNILTPELAESLASAPPNGSHASDLGSESSTR